MLRWLHGQHLQSFVLPELIGLERHAELTLLLLGAPPLPGMERSLEADHREAAVLSELASLNQASMPLADLFGTWDMDAFAEYLRAEDHAKATTVTRALRSIENILGRSAVRLSAVSRRLCPVEHTDAGRWPSIRV